MWRADTDRAMRSTMVALEVIDSAPDSDRLVKAHELATRNGASLIDSEIQREQ
jgi:hypothetical protein